MPAITIILLLTGYCGYFIVTWRNYKNKTHKLYSGSGFCSNIKKLNRFHITGIFLLGLPLVFVNKEAAIFLAGSINIHLQNILVLSSLVILTVFITLKTANTTLSKLYLPAISVVEKSLKFYLPIRVLFILMYEFFFRGVLLAVCIQYAGVEAAIVINVLLYTLMHAFSEKKEIIFCPLFGTILCLLTLWFHSVLPALLLHTTLAVSNEGTILKKITQSTKQYQS